MVRYEMMTGVNGESIMCPVLDEGSDDDNPDDSGLTVSQLHQQLQSNGIPISSHSLACTESFMRRMHVMIIDHLKRRSDGGIAPDVIKEPPSKKRRRGRPCKPEAKWNKLRSKTLKHFRLSSVVRSCVQLSSCCLKHQLRMNTTAPRVFDDIVMSRMFYHSITGKFPSLVVRIKSYFIEIARVMRQMVNL